MNHAELEKQLAELPSQIRDAQNAHIEAKEKLEMAKLRYKVAHATALVNSKAPNATEKSSLALIKTQNEQEELIKDETEAARKESELDYLNNRFNSLRKIASIEIELIKTQTGGY